MKEQMHDLTSPQKSIWLTEQFYKETTIGNITGFLMIEEKTNIDVLKQAINIFVKNNEGMRIKIFEENGIPKQYVSEYKYFNIEEIELNEDEAEQAKHEYAKIPFKLIESDLFKFTIVKMPNGNAGFLINIHHIIGDAWTMSITANQVTSIYSKLLDKEEIEETKYSYIDYIKAEEEYKQSEKYLKDKEYWNNVFSTLPDVSKLSTKEINEKKISTAAGRLGFKISKEKTLDINEFCRENKTSPYAFFMAVISIYLSKINRLNEIIIGSPILNRSNFKEKNTTGMFISTVPFKCKIEQQTEFIEYLGELSSDLKSMLRHQKYPYECLLEDMRTQYGMTNNLYDIALSYQNARDNNNSSKVKYSTGWGFNNNVSNSMDIHIYDLDDTKDYTIYYDYQKNKFNEEDIEALNKRLYQVIDKVLKNKNTKILDIEILGEEEKNYIINNFNNTVTEYPEEKSVLTLFEEQVKLTPNKIALSFEDKTLTYKELHEKVETLASNLINDGVKENDNIVLIFSHSFELMISILAALKCGACYIPIDPEYPNERIEYIIKDSNPSKILTNDIIIKEKFDIFKSEYIDTDKISKLKLYKDVKYPNDDKNRLAYILYTSGSTGKPKGVKIKHLSLTNYIYWAKKTYVNNKKSNFALYTSISFDLTVTTVFTPLISGNTMYIYSDDNAEMLLFSIIENKDIDVLKLTPAHLQLLTTFKVEDISINRLIVGGEDLKKSLSEVVCDKFNNNVEIYNEYGPTEATVGCMIYTYNKKDEYISVPIGKPVDNAEIYILDENENIMPVGYLGEMYIAGKCLADGYLNLDDTTKNVFKYSEKLGKMLYKTGDLAKFIDKDTIIYANRIGNQVKINGYRVELDEIKNIIEKYPNCTECFIMPMESESKSIELCAYLVSSSEIEVHELREHLSRYLPYYMIPKYIINIDYLPLNINGKIDTKQLPAPEVVDNTEYVAPKTKLERDIESVFCELFEIEKMSINTDFLANGADSLTIIKARTLIEQKGYKVNLQDFYENTTIKLLAKKINEGKLISKILLKNDLINDVSTKKSLIEYSPKDKESVLVIGSNGFLGIHIVYNLLQSTDYKIICMIRNKDNVDGKTRFKNIFNSYFGENEFKKYISRIEIVVGDIGDKLLGLDEEEYERIGNSIKEVFDSAAVVKHYGTYKEFKKVNVDSTKNIIDFCIKHNVPMHYVSTITVSGYGLVNNVPVKFTENSLYVGQDYLGNVYVRTKFEAEQLVVKSLEKGLIANIYRVGNLTPRYSDGKGQLNSKENAFMNRLNSIISMGIIPSTILNASIDFTPIDLCADIIVKLSGKIPYNINYYHIYNNALTYNELVNYLKACNINLKKETLQNFMNKIKELNTSNNLFGLTNYLDNLIDKKTTQVILDNSYTNQVLSELNFKWPKLEEKYITNLLKNVG